MYLIIISDASGRGVICHDTKHNTYGHNIYIFTTQMKQKSIYYGMLYIPCLQVKQCNLVHWYLYLSIMYPLYVNVYACMV